MAGSDNSFAGQSPLSRHPRRSAVVLVSLLGVADSLFSRSFLALWLGIGWTLPPLSAVSDLQAGLCSSPAFLMPAQEAETWASPPRGTFRTCRAFYGSSWHARRWPPLTVA